MSKYLYCVFVWPHTDVQTYQVEIKKIPELRVDLRVVQKVTDKKKVDVKKKVRFYSMIDY